MATTHLFDRIARKYDLPALPDARSASNTSPICFSRTRSSSAARRAPRSPSRTICPKRTASWPACSWPRWWPPRARAWPTLLGRPVPRVRRADRGPEATSPSRPSGRRSCGSSSTESALPAGRPAGAQGDHDRGLKLDLADDDWLLLRCLGHRAAHPLLRGGRVPGRPARAWSSAAEEKLGDREKVAGGWKRKAAVGGVRLPSVHPAHGLVLRQEGPGSRSSGPGRPTPPCSRRSKA